MSEGIVRKHYFRAHARRSYRFAGTSIFSFAGITVGSLSAVYTFEKHGGREIQKGAERKT